MATASGSAQALSLSLNEEERTLLLSVLEQALRDKRVEIHRTEAIDYREHLQQQETILEGLIGRLSRR